MSKFCYSVYRISHLCLSLCLDQLQVFITNCLSTLLYCIILISTFFILNFNNHILPVFFLSKICTSSTFSVFQLAPDAFLTNQIYFYFHHYFSMIKIGIKIFILNYLQINRTNIIHIITN